MNTEIIVSVFVGMILYNLVVASIGKAILHFIIENSSTLKEVAAEERQKIKDKINKDDE